MKNGTNEGFTDGLKRVIMKIIPEKNFRPS